MYGASQGLPPAAAAERKVEVKGEVTSSSFIQVTTYVWQQDEDGDEAAHPALARID